MRKLKHVKLSQSLAASVDFRAMEVGHLTGYSLVVKVTDGGSVTGTLKLQGSNNAIREDSSNGDVDSAAVWVDISGSSQNVTTDGNFLWNVADCYYDFVRLVYTRSAGTGTADVYFSGKGPQS